MPDETPVIQKPNELDVVLVYNPDINCNVIDTEDGYPHSDYFQVKWANHPHRIPPGKTKKMPRFLAEHYAKHLANHILTKMEEETNRKGLVQSVVERPKIISQILLGVDSYFLGESEVDEGEATAQKVDALNPEERAMDLGEIPNPLMGVLKEEPKPVEYGDEPVTTVGDNPNGPVVHMGDAVTTHTGAVTTETKIDVKPSIWDESKPKPTKRELLADCEKLGIEVTGKETVDQLISKIKAF